MKVICDSLALEKLPDNPHFIIFKEVESLLSDSLLILIQDMSIKKGVLWIKVKHPSASLLLLMQKMAIMSKLKRLSNSFCIRDLRVIIALDNSLELPKEKKNSIFSVEVAPTGIVEGEREPINSPHIKELMETLRLKIQERKD